MKCYICEKDENKVTIYDYGEIKICKECHDNCRMYYAMKCENCGSYGFIKKNPENKRRLGTLLESCLDEKKLIVIPTNKCMNCMFDMPNNGIGNS